MKPQERKCAKTYKNPLVFDDFGAVLGPSWERLGPSWGRLGAVLGRLGGVLGRLGAVLGRLGREDEYKTSCVMIDETSRAEMCKNLRKTIGF